MLLYGIGSELWDVEIFLQQLKFGILISGVWKAEFGVCERARGREMSLLYESLHENAHLD